MNLCSATILAALFLALAVPASAFAQNPAAEAQPSGPPKDQTEAADYANAKKVADPTRRAEALEAFVKRYPNSSAKILALEWAVNAYHQAGNGARTLELARHVLGEQPESVRAMAAYVQQARAMGDQGPDDAREFAMQGLPALAAWQKPWDLTQDDFLRLQSEMTGTFTSAIAYYAMIGRDLGTARMYFQQALLSDPMSLEDNYSLGLVDIEMQPIDPVGFWYIARSIHLAKAAKNGGDSFIASYARLKYAQFHGDMQGWDEIVKRAANQTTLPEDFTVPQNAPPAAPDNPQE